MRPRRYILLIGLLFFVVFFFIVWVNIHKSGVAMESSGMETVDESAVTAAEPENLQSAQLLADIQNCTAGDATKYAIYVELLDNDGPPLILQSQSMRSASLIKVFLLAKVMDMEKAGRLYPEQLLTVTPAVRVGGAGSLCGQPDGFRISLQDTLFLMITESDNTATNMVIDLIGMSEVNAYIQQHGYTDTVLQRRMMDQKAASEGRENYTSVRDLGLFFHRLYHGQCVDSFYDQQMRDILLQQTDRECFPAALPANRIAHKTGELTGLYDDAGIIYAPSTSYILCIMDEQMAGRTRTLQTMRAVASSVDAFAGQDGWKH